MGQACSVEENSRRERRRKLGYGTGVLLHDPNVAIRGGARVRICNREAPRLRLQSERRRAAKTEDTEDINATARSSGADSRGLFGSGDAEDVQFLDAVKGLVDGAVKLAGAEQGVGAWIISGLFRKTGFVDSFVDSIVSFMNRRLQSLTEALAPKDMAIAVAVCLRKHVQAHDKTTETLGISAGRRRSKKKRAAPRESEASGDAGGGNGGFGGDDREELEEDEVQVVVLWREWKRSGGFWPDQMPDPEDPAFGEDEDGAKEFICQLDDGVETFLLDLARHYLHTALPEDGEELRQAVGATNFSAANGTSSRGMGEQETAKAAADTANRLSKLKNSVLEPILAQVLREQVIRRCCETSTAWQFLLNLWSPSADLDFLGHDLDQPEAFSLMAGALGKLDKGNGGNGASGGSLRMDLMQGLVKMTWGASSREEPSASSRGVLPVLNQGASTAGDKSGRLGLPREGSQRSLSSREDRLGSFDSGADWSEIGSDFGGGDWYLASPRGGAPGVSGSSSPRSFVIAGKRGASSIEGARDIFNMPYTEQLSRGLAGDMGDKMDDFFDDVEARALEELEKAWNAEMTKHFPLGKRVFPTTWVMGRIRAARSLARRPTNLMMVLSVLDAAKDILRQASDKHIKMAKARSRAGAVGTATDDVGNGEEKRDPKDRGEVKAEPGLQVSKGGVSSRGLSNLPRSRAATRDTPGWRAWEARREWFFGSDLGKVGLHFGRSLLGEGTIGLASVILKSVSLEYTSVETLVRDQSWMALQKCSKVDSADVVMRMKPVSTQPILYVSSQMRMLRALKKTSLDFSKSIGDGPQKKALSRRFKTYCWLFTDSLIKKLVNIRMKERARTRALGSPDGGNSPKRSGAGEGRARELQREKGELRTDVLREITSCRSSKDLLKQLLLSWLPQTVQADSEEKATAEREIHGRS